VSALDLSDGVSSRSGEANDYTLGANWYLGRNFRLMGNYVHSEVDTIDPTRDRDVDVIEARAQIDF
jgi:phosphate-selective porin OprO/OprP